MKKYEIHVSYSWGDEEEPIEFEEANDTLAFMRMLEYAAKEINVCISDSHDDCIYTLTAIPYENKIILHYGYDDEECYYQLKTVG